ncbi:MULTISPECIES: NADPH-dependent F420 reductase [Streptomyces]|uniref:NADP oxidoreductase, coenzyme F420-dependent n=1 Tax=Streptomyces venezuelae (strain ATCC 10712 / CBS 650.69 / DSM 40230 / JCM 4526 / NBRC 13096 / PD 04745) TaxID=953739 RepID=F2RIM1_STRVP|nr:NAD(P)-binding domain-containing protein [Streptomyces venezuelae]APE23273.1 NADP oxidoreductase [Streptomyces venezuelae]QES00651.1 NADP oxidoreductase [Streptomyces venezuelae ATCC 10712]CCA57577.1 NADP oxidoreductase, coenzyme F420-dependent [Streptomyces venezuelae ATCC 10712]
MKIAVLGTGEVGRRLATKLVSLGHEVTMGSRTADNPEAAKWAEEHGGGAAGGSGGEAKGGTGAGSAPGSAPGTASGSAAHGTFADAATPAELVVNATGGLVSLAVLESVGSDGLRGKVLVDVSNGLDFSEGFPPKVVTPDGGSVAEQLQRAFPEARVVKTLNTMTNTVMVEPGRVPGHHNVFLSGDDEDAKAVVAELLGSFGWASDRIIDLGDLSSARATEQLLPLWLRLYGKFGTGDFNFAVVTAPGV